METKKYNDIVNKSTREYLSERMMFSSDRRNIYNNYGLGKYNEK